MPKLLPLAQGCQSSNYTRGSPCIKPSIYNVSTTHPRLKMQVISFSCESKDLWINLVANLGETFAVGFAITKTGRMEFDIAMEGETMLLQQGLARVIGKGILGEGSSSCSSCCCRRWCRSTSWSYHSSLRGGSCGDWQFTVKRRQMSKCLFYCLHVRSKPENRPLFHNVPPISLKRLIQILVITYITYISIRDVPTALVYQCHDSC